MKIFHKQPPEIEEGNREYKLKLNIMDKERFDRFTSQMKFRLYEGDGKAVYIIGISDDGQPFGISDEELEISINEMRRAVNSLNAKINTIRYYNGQNGSIMTVKISKELIDFYFV
jgi:GTPase